RYLAPALPDGGRHGFHRPGARHVGTLWPDRLHREPARQRVWHSRRHWREPARPGLARREPPPAARGHWHRGRRRAYRGGSSAARRGLPRTGRLVPRSLHSGSAGVAIRKRRCQLCSRAPRRRPRSPPRPPRRVGVGRLRVNPAAPIPLYFCQTGPTMRPIALFLPTWVALPLLLAQPAAARIRSVRTVGLGCAIVVLPQHKSDVIGYPPAD